MPNAEQAKRDYDASAPTYGAYSSLPSGRLESELVRKALGDCTGLAVLDLGGGTGVHAREALDLGASAVDLVDVSPRMLDEAARFDHRPRDGGGTLRFFEADVSRPLSHLPLRPGGYDVVMGNWIFSFAADAATLDAMLRNVAAHLRPGGRFVAARDADPASPALASGKYGGSCSRLERIPGGFAYRCVLHTAPPVEFEGAALDVLLSGSAEVFERFGLVDVAVLPCGDSDVVREDPAFWREFVERPCFVVMTARKREDAGLGLEQP